MTYIQETFSFLLFIFQNVHFRNLGSLNQRVKHMNVSNFVHSASLKAYQWKKELLRVNTVQSPSPYQVRMTLLPDIAEADKNGGG